jgi:DNA-binding NarL/FixJ family response regulator
VADLLAEERTNRQIGDVLFTIEETVSVRVTDLLRKLGVPSRTGAAERRRRLGWADRKDYDLGKRLMV